MSEQTGAPGPASEDAQRNEDESVRVREQTANDLGSPDAFGPDETASNENEDAAARYQVPED